MESLFRPWWLVNGGSFCRAFHVKTPKLTGWIVRNRIETSLRPLPFYREFTLWSIFPCYQHRGNSFFHKDVLFPIFFLPLPSLTFFFLSKMFFSLGRNGFDFYQSSNPRRNWSQRLCYIIRGKRMIEKSDIYKFNRIDLSITELNLEREEFSRFTWVILCDEPLRPINNSSISIESPIQAGWYQNIIRHAATTLLNNPHPPL